MVLIITNKLDVFKFLAINNISQQFYLKKKEKIIKEKYEHGNTSSVFRLFNGTEGVEVIFLELLRYGVKK